MKRDVSTTGAAARALGARNPIAFECIHSLEESVRRLAEITDPPLPFVRPRTTLEKQLDTPMAPVPKRPNGTVDAHAVRLDWDRAVRFEGRWTATLDRARLEGTMVPRGPGLNLLLAFAILAVTAVTSIVKGAYWPLAFIGLVLVIVMPLVVAALGSSRVAAEIELERIIGQAIGDPEKYATHWRKWRED